MSADADLPNGWTLREVDSGDLGALHALRLRAIREHPDAFGASPEVYPDAPAYAVQHAERVAGGMVSLAVFDAAGTPLAMGQLTPQGIPKEAHKGFITAMYTAPEARGLGLGGALLTALIDRARALGLERLVIAVTDHNPAKRLYRRAGFEVWGTEPQALKVDGRGYDEVWMGLALTAAD